MFGYFRFFLILSILAIVAVVGAASVTFQHMVDSRVTRVVENRHETITNGYIADVWQKYRDVMLPLLKGGPDQLRGNPQVTQFAQDTVQYFQKMPIIRINLYKGDGALLMTLNPSKDNALQGTDASPDNAWIASKLKTGHIASHILHNVALQSNERALVVQTLQPVLYNGKEVDIALEALSDASAAEQGVSGVQYYLLGGCILLFMIFFGVLYLSSRKAESIIARLHEETRELNAAVAAAEAENKDKSQFLANVSHELRTPLNAIIGFSDILKTEVMPTVQDQKYHNYMDDIHSAGVHLLSLINDILDFSKAEAGKLELEVSEINVARMVQNCVRLVQPRAVTAEVKLVEELPKEQVVIINDGKKFKQILLNLLSNAIKFTPTGGQVSISAWHNLADDTFSFEVKDTGIGIAPKDISRAMSPFGQVDNSMKRKYEGTGLGLPLTKKFVELMGGKFTIESELNKGTTIIFTLPRELKPRDGVIIKQLT